MKYKSGNKIWKAAHADDYSIIRDKRSETMLDERNSTPQHVLARRFCDAVMRKQLTSEEITIIINLFKESQILTSQEDKGGFTLLHILARTGILAFVEVGGFFTIKNRLGDTPYNHWLDFGNRPLTCFDIINHTQSSKDN